MQGLSLDFKRAVASSFIWGLGQWLNKQRIKAIAFFTVQCVIIINELYTGYYLEYLSGNLDEPFYWGSHGGFFGKGIWGILTLGQKPRQITENGITDGDHSVILLINGIFALLVLSLVVFIYIVNIRDAKYIARKINNNEYVDREISKRRIENYLTKQYPYVVSFPAILGLCIFVLIPILFSFLVAFTNYNIYHIPPTKLVDWVGFKNFLDIFRIPIWSKTFWGVLTWNISFALILTLGTLAIGLVQALIINAKGIVVPKFWRAILILPWAMPALITLLVFRVIFNGQFGPLNNYLLDMGLISQRIPWFTDPSYSRMMIFVVSFWLGFPYWMVLCSGVLTGIEPTMKEAAKIDGANDIQVFRYVVFPQLMNAIKPLVILTTAGNFNNFGLIYFLTGGGPANPEYQFAGNTDILISWIYKLTLDQRIYNMASVMSILIFLFVAPIAAYNLLKTKAFKEGEEV